MNVKAIRLAGFVGAILFAGSCGPDCTDANCEDTVLVTLHTTDGLWPNGMYSFDVAFSGDAFTCTMTLPAESLQSLGVLELDCPPEHSAFLVSEVQCTQMPITNGVSQSCSPVLGQFKLELTLAEAAPDSVEISASRDGTVLITENAAVTYEDVHLGGASCPASCVEGSVEITM